MCPDTLAAMSIDKALQELYRERDQFASLERTSTERDQQLATKVAPTTSAALKVYAQFFHHAWEVCVGCRTRWAETDTCAIRNLGDGCDAG